MDQTKTTHSIGRSRTNDIVLNDRSVSREHARIEAVGNGRYRLVDLNSSVGTFILRRGDWEVVHRAEVMTDDRIKLGDHVTVVSDLFAAEAEPTDIFISYSSVDRPRVKEIATALRARGWRLWWDQAIPTGVNYDDVIEQQLTNARAVVVAWSRSSVKSRWVRAEADDAMSRGILVPILVEPTGIPLVFRQLQAAQMQDWQGARDHPGFLRLISRLEELVGSPAISDGTVSGHTPYGSNARPADQILLPKDARVEGYAIDSVIAKSGFSVTYLARDITLGRPVAVKEYLPTTLATRLEGSADVWPVSEGESANYDFGLAQFTREARTLIRFDHPNIVKVINYLEANRTAYIVTSYVEGHDLASILRGRQTLSGEELERLIWPLLDALAMIHDEDVLHRGIKPDNILIGPQGRPLLHDFGAARQALSQQTNSLKSFVTSGYSPIEQYSARGNQGPWTDIYGLGATLYRAVTGSKPPDAVHRAHADTYAPAADVAGREHPRNILLGIDKALAWKAAERPQSIAELRAIFETGQSG